MRQKSNSTPASSETLVRNIRRATRKHHGWVFRALALVGARGVCRTGVSSSPKAIGDCSARRS